MNTEPNELGLTFSSPTKTLTGHSFRSIGYVGDQTTPKTDYRDGIFLERQGHMLLGLDLNISEKLYGLGERFGPFLKNGQTVDIWNEDGGTSSDLAYKNIPFYISSCGYGVFVNHPGKVSLEMQTERSSRVNISIEGEELQYFVVYGPSPKEILRRYAALTGEPALVPAWSYNLWLTTSMASYSYYRLDLRSYERILIIVRLHNKLRRTNRHLLPRRLPRPRHPTRRLPLRLLLDEVLPVV